MFWKNGTGLYLSIGAICGMFFGVAVSTYALIIFDAPIYWPGMLLDLVVFLILPYAMIGILAGSVAKLAVWALSRR